MNDAALMRRFKATCKRLKLEPLAVLRYLIRDFVEAADKDSSREALQ